jgi:predicted nucleotidyltransferase
MPKAIKIKTTVPLTRWGILSLLRANEDILKKCKVKRIGLFGSYARGQQRRGSDVDFLVEFTEPTYDNFYTLSVFLERLFRKKVELITPDGLSPYMKPFVEKEARWHEVR